MYLSRHNTPHGPRWALDGKALPDSFSLGLLLELPQAAIAGFLNSIPTGQALSGDLLPPLEARHEVWACGVTYLISRDARRAESSVADVYSKVYDAPRPEIFFKASGWRVVGSGQSIRIRRDSTWNVPEPELTLVVNRHLEIVGFCAGNDVSSRDIEGENPLYLPQAKTYNQSCALGPGIQLTDVDALRDIPLKLAIQRAGQAVFKGEIRSSQMKRTPEELVADIVEAVPVPVEA